MVDILALEKEVKVGEGKIARIQQSKTGFEQQISSLKAEEQSLIVSARTGDEVAKTRLSEVREGIRAAEREIQDDASAISHIASEIEKLRAALASEQFEAARNKVLREVARFTEGAKASRDRLRAATAELRTIGALCDSEADAVRNLLTQLDGELASKSERTVKLSALELTRSLTQAVNLLEVPSYAGHSLDCMAQMQRFIVALEHLARDIKREVEPVPA